MKWFPFSVIRELGCEDGFDVFGVCGEDAATTGGSGFDGVGWAAGGDEPGYPGFEVVVRHGAADAGVDEVDVCSEGRGG